ncbi:LOW QUALITY PROTEIN: ubiquinone/menaquinone biosynthesis methyltransferase UbiE [Bacillus sp. JCM 19046]|nr:LOW QUALITY PROTEIN: ubiquinone/menaquinone biosynthesis methyltransferase UbiE [Bacillus sp. JCM 19045]GAF17623.1 LOW QUALITY PROTEIN: ubiquinone/menaquinone biosynthesis methyltransferase UbiE [Bacillus sp. JCM 19046]
MKHNSYDNHAFFEKYSQMDRSVKGLAGAGEWSTLEPLLPAFKGKSVLDLGCGYGWHSMYAAEHGATSVIGVDLSTKMLEVAEEKSTAFNNVNYVQSGIEDFEIKPGQFDVILSSLALHYVPSFDEVAKKSKRRLKANGQFIFSVEHPVFTAEGSQEWIYGQDNEIAHFPVDNYYYEGERKATFLGETVVKYHKTLTTYLDGLLTNGFRIERVVEPMPAEGVRSLPGMKDEMRRPMMLIVVARKE